MCLISLVNKNVNKKDVCSFISVIQYDYIYFYSLEVRKSYTARHTHFFYIKLHMQFLYLIRTNSKNEEI